MPLKSNKDIAVQCLKLVVAGRIDEAYHNYIDMKGKHHNPFFPAGFPELKKAMEENHTQFPAKQLIIQHVVSEDDLVAVHSHIIPVEGHKGLAVIHLFRFQDGKIIETWECGQPVPEESPNKDGMF